MQYDRYGNPTERLLPLRKPNYYGSQAEQDFFEKPVLKDLSGGVNSDQEKTERWGRDSNR